MGMDINKIENEIRIYDAGQTVPLNGADTENIEINLSGDLTQTDEDMGLAVDLSRKDKKGMRSAVIADLPIVLSGIAFDKTKIMESFDKKYEKLPEKSYIRGTLRQAIEEVADIVASLKPETAGTKDRVEALREDAKSKIGDDELRSFKLDVLDALIDNIAQTVMNEEFNHAQARYADLRHPELSRDPEIKNANHVYSRTEAMAILKKEYKDSYSREVLERIENEVVMADAHEEVWAAIYAQRGNLDATTQRQVKLNVKAVINNDKYTRRVNIGKDELELKDRVGDFATSSTRANRRAVAAENRVNKVRRDGVTRDQLNKVFKTRLFDGRMGSNREAVTMLEEKGLIAGRADGKVDVTKLSQLIELTVSKAQFAMDYQKKDYMTYSEVQNAINNILAENGVTNVTMTHEDVIALAKLCGFDYNEDGLFKKIWQNTLGGVAAGATGAVSSLLTGAKSVADAILNGPSTLHYNYTAQVPWTIQVNINNELHLVFDSNTNYVGMDPTTLANQLLAQGFNFMRDENGNLLGIVYTDNGFELHMIQQSTTTLEGFTEWADEFDISLEGLFGADVDLKDPEMLRRKAMMFSAAMAVALTLLQAALSESRGELPVAATQFDDENMTYEKYINMLSLDKKNPAVAQALMSLADVFVQKDENGNPLTDKDGNILWNKTGYKQFLNGIAGDMSMLNRDELLIGVDRALRDLKNIPTEDPILKRNKELEVKVDELQSQLDDCANLHNVDEEPVDTVVTTEQTNPQNTPDNQEILIAEKVVRCETIDARTSGWDKLASTYECSDETWPKGTGYDARTKRRYTYTSRIMKLAQGIEDGDYSKERIDILLEIVKTAKTHEEFKKMLEEKGITEKMFNYEKYLKALGANALQHVRMPDELYGCPRDKNASIRVPASNKGGNKGKSVKVTTYNTDGYENAQHKKKEKNVTSNIDGDEYNTLRQKPGVRVVDFNELDQ